MADVINRDDKESGLARAIAKEMNRARQELMDMFPTMAGWMRDVDPSFWDLHAANLTAAIAPELMKDFMLQAETMMAGFDFLGVEWGLVNQDAADWARQYTFQLVKELTDTSRATLQKLIPAYFEQGWTQGQLRDQLASSFSITRAEMIARTEVTRAASEAEQATARLLEAQGIRMRPVWQTRNDEIVCPLCGPKHNKEIEDGMYPPAHPRCRCWYNNEIILED